MTQSSSNQLADETSPYLLEHADNPVDWYPWGEEALARAQDEDKPIFLSIGYSACHWCHVMKRESFQDPETAERMNEWFVNIKVDREERPDLDEIYMQAVQSMTGRGGWPMSVFLTPDRKPFYGGTYFPPEPRQGMPSFKTVLERVHKTYQEKRDDVEQTADQMTEQLRGMEGPTEPEDLPDSDLMARTYTQLLKKFDPDWGGFGQAPKFPRVMDLQFLMRHQTRRDDDQADEMVRLTLDRMMQGGLYDQVGGGFARYSTDEKWLVPHFEKMLYDNALLLRVYSDGYRSYGDDRYREVVERTFDYLQREMSHPDGGFFSSQDAESEGEEGKYYVWDYEEFHEVLGENSDLLGDFWGVTEEGNFEGRNILHVSESIDSFCEDRDRGPDSLQTMLEKARNTLLEVRAERVKPHRDEKILTDWNGLMAGALARAGLVFNRDDFLDRCESCLEFLEQNLVREELIHHTHRDGRTHTPGFLDDYAFLIAAELDYFQARGDKQWLERARDHYRRAVDRFWDGDNGGFFYTDDHHEDVIVRSKNPQDKSQPSGNSEMVLNGLKLAGLTGEDRYRERSQEILETFAGLLDRGPTSMTRMLCGLHDYYAGSTELVLVGSDSERGDLLDPVREIRFPGLVVYPANPRDATEQDSELLVGRLDKPLPAAYLCREGTCRRPVETADELAEYLRSLLEEGD